MKWAGKRRTLNVTFGPYYVGEQTGVKLTRTTKAGSGSKVPSSKCFFVSHIWQ